MVVERMKGILKGDKVVLSQEAIEELYNNLYYGRLKGDTLELALVEAAYLLDREKITVEIDGTERTFRDFFIAASHLQEYFELKYIVYRDLQRARLLCPAQRDGLPGLSSRWEAQRLSL